MAGRRRTLLGTVGMLLVLVIGAVVVFNASWRVAPPENPEVALIAHRGVHHTYSRENLDNDTCTAEQIFPPTHTLFENTLPSMEAAFAAGADIVELDIHPTTDGELAVLHDWTVDCRTEGTGTTRELSMAELATLDIGFGYTADGGATYPLRGLGVGLMPTLSAVFEAFPDQRFLINFKSNEAREAGMVAALADATGATDAVWGAYGGDPPTRALSALAPDNATWTRAGLVDCVTGYVGLGWTGFIPEACRNTTIMVPVNIAGWLWGWPNLFLARMAEAGTEVILIGPYTGGDIGTTGIDDLETLADVPPGFSGYLWTNRIEIIGPALGRGQPLPEDVLL